MSENRCFFDGALGRPKGEKIDPWGAQACGGVPIGGAIRTADTAVAVLGGPLLVQYNILYKITYNTI